MEKQPSAVLLTQAILSVLVLVIPGAAGSGSWVQSGKDFLKGELTDLQFNDSGLILSPARDWSRANAGQPVPTTGQGMAYDSINRKVVLFGGGLTNYEGYNRTWLYDLGKNEWSSPDPYPCPSGRQDHSMVFDAGKGVVVLFGGWSGGAHVNDTWTYDAGTNVWTNVSPALSPPARDCHAMAYDSARGLIVMFGGGGTSPFNDTWTYNASTNVWTDVSPTISPSDRGYHGLVYDRTADAVMMFGGSHRGTLVNDTWAFDAGARRWAQKAPPGAPAPRCGHAMVYDGLNGRTLLYGGEVGAFCYKDIWSYDAARDDWSLLETNATPGDRAEHSLVWDGSSGNVVLFGGTSYAGFWPMYGAWTLKTATMKWTYNEPLNPFWRYGSAMAYDSRNGVAVLFGGRHSLELNDTWTYNATDNRWRKMSPPFSPPARFSPSMAYDGKTGEVLLFGGYGAWDYYCDTWAYNVSADRWTELAPAAHPSARAGAAMAYDRLAGGVVLFGGAASSYWNDTWCYDPVDATWKELASLPPETIGRAGAAMAYDPLAGEMVMFGGEFMRDVLGDTWTYNYTKNRWSERKTPVSPAGRQSSNLVYCEPLRGVLLFGGTDPAGAFCRDTWTFRASANTWDMRNLRSSMPQRTLAPMSYDPVADKAVVFGGVNGETETEYDDTWTYSITEGYTQNGAYISPPFDCGGAAHFGGLYWAPPAGPNSTVKLWLRTADTEENLSGMPFLGPAGNIGTEYAISGQEIYFGHNGSRWVQYRMVLGTKKPAESPQVRSVRLDYNLLQDLEITSPAGGENWTGIRTVSWNLSDPDNDEMFFDIDLLAPSGAFGLARNLSNLTRGFSWNTTPVENGTYSIRITASDRSGVPISVAATSPKFEIQHPPPPPNRPPVTALVSPEDNATARNGNATLLWEGSDPDGDPLTYYVSFGRNRSDVAEGRAVVSHQAETRYDLTGLTMGTYFWSVTANDGTANSTQQGVRCLAVPRPNLLPRVSLLDPADGSVIDIPEIELRWNGSDADNDSLRYFVSAGENLSLVLGGGSVVAVQNGSTYVLTGLRDGGRYFWTVIPFDGEDNGTVRQGYFSFSVSLRPNRLPRFTSQPLEEATVGVPYRYDARAVDDDNDPLAFSIPRAPAGMGINSSTGAATWVPRRDQLGMNNISIMASDGRGVTYQNFTIAVNEMALPRCSITSPSSGEVVKGVYIVKGSASAGGPPLVLVELRLDGGIWKNASGTADWSLSIETALLADGSHFLEARAYDGGNYSEIAKIEFEVDNSHGTNGQSSMPILVLIAVLVIFGGGLAAILIVRRRKPGRPQPE